MVEFTKDFILGNMAPFKGTGSNRFHINIQGYSVSIIGGGMAYGDGVNTFEVMVTKGDDPFTKDIFPDDTDSTGAVAGFISLQKIVYGLNCFFSSDTYV